LNILKTIRIGPYEGWILEEMPDKMRELLPFWLVGRRVEDGKEIVSGRVYRWNNYIVKFFGSKWAPQYCFRHSPAWRAAKSYYELKPILSPCPIALFERKSFFRMYESAIILKYLEGRTLKQVWNNDSSAIEGLPSFFAEMHKRRIFHCDLSINNLLWTENKWALLDLDSIDIWKYRRILYSLSYKYYVLYSWKKLYCSLQLDDKLQEVFFKYLDETGLSWNKESTWNIIDHKARKSYKRIKIRGHD
jgi:hypothetical protein